MSKMRFFLSLAAAGLVILPLATAPLLGQGATSSLRGVVTDPSGGVIPGAQVTLTNQSTGKFRQTLTNDTGTYVFPQVDPGNYTVKVEMTGFKTVVAEEVALEVGIPVTLDLEMELGEISQTVTISAQGEQVNTTDASVGNAFSEIKIRELPLLTRNVVNLLSLQVGVNQSGEVAGGRNDQNNVTLDGVDVNDQQSPGAFESVLPIPLDSVQEFRVTTVGQTADLGRSSGGQVSLISKSGTNEWHGSVYEFHRNTKTAANTFFNNANGIERAALIRNQFGFSVGGPIKKDRVFFFFNFEQRRDASQDNESRLVPSEAMKQGILTFRASDGSIQQLTPEEIARIDPRGIGNSPAMIQRLQAYPAANDPDLGLDRGLNFSGFRFNAPLQIDRKAYVAKFDFNITEDGAHTVAWRGTLADEKDDDIFNLAQFPGQEAAKFLDNSRGLSTNYTAIISPNVVNTFTYGFTRQGLERSGLVDSQRINVRSLSEPFNIAATAFGRAVPTHNVADNFSWVKGNHSFDAGINFRFIRNDRFSFANSFATFNINNGAMAGLGGDIIAPINDFLMANRGVTLGPGAATPMIRAMMANLGTIADVSATFQFDRDGSVLPQGEPQLREFAVNEYEFYLQDSWKIRQDFTLTLGIRYTNSTVPWEVNGLQVNPQPGLSNFFNERVDLMQASQPSNQAPLLTFDLAGPENNAPGYFERDKNNWAPRVALAWSPDFDAGGVGRFLGLDGNAVFRAGASVVYDRFGSEMIVNFDGLGAVGLATNTGFPQTFDFTTAPRFDGTFPALPDPPPGGFPNTPPINFAVLNDTFGIAEDLRTPYSYLFNLNYQRLLAKDLSVEFGYVGRLGRKLLGQLDVASPLNNLALNGQTWAEAAGALRDLTEGAGLTIADVENNPGGIPLQPFIEAAYPGLANLIIPGSATANMYWVIQFFGGFSEGDALHFADVQAALSPFGAHFLFEQQTSARPTWFNASNSIYNALTVAVRKRLTGGLAFDFNYTYGHSIDHGSSPETGAGQFGGVILDAFNIAGSKGNSAFDIRHQFNANWLYELPWGRGRRFGAGMPAWLDAAIGGWKVAGIVRYQTALPTSPGTGFNFTTNFFLTGSAAPTGDFETEVGTNSNGVPGIFPDPEQARQLWRHQRVGETGPRNIVRLDDFVNTDLTILKEWGMPWAEGHRLQFRWELFNAFNNVNFTPDSVSLDPFDNPETFGEFSNTTSPRVMQFALRYEF